MLNNSDREFARYVRTELVACRAIGGDLLVIPVRRGVSDAASIYTFNETGKEIWERLSAREALSARQLAEDIRQKFAVSAEDALQHTIAFLEELQREGLVTLAQATAEPQANPAPAP